MAENWGVEIHHAISSLYGHLFKCFSLSHFFRYELLKKMLIYIVLEHNPQKYMASKLLRSKVKKSVVLSPKGDTLPESLYYGYD